MNDLNTIREYTTHIAQSTNTPAPAGAMQQHRAEVVVESLAEAGEHNTVAAYANAEHAAISAKARMVRAYGDLASEFPELEKRVKSHVAKVNDLTGRVAQSLAKSRDIMGPQVEDRLRQLERFVDCLERLQKLDADGIVTRFGEALSGRRA